jgi:WD40 repeat protein
VRLWDVPSGKPLGQPLTAHTSEVDDVEFSPDGKLVASADANDGTVLLWDIETKRWFPTLVETQTAIREKPLRVAAVPDQHEGSRAVYAVG